MKNVIKIETTVNRNCSTVWNLWNGPEHIVKWNFASDDWHCPAAENDLKAGGKLRSRMESRDGRTGFDFEAVYDEVIPETKISYTITDGRHVITDFENLGEKTRISTAFEAEEENSIEMQKAGWQAILDNFKKYAESL